MQGLLQVLTLHGLNVLCCSGVAHLRLLLLEGLHYHSLGDDLGGFHLDVDYLLGRLFQLLFLDAYLLISVVLVVLLHPGFPLVISRHLLLFNVEELRKQLLARLVDSLRVADAQRYQGVDVEELQTL